MAIQVMKNKGEATPEWMQKMCTAVRKKKVVKDNWIKAVILLLNGDESKNESRITEE